MSQYSKTDDLFIEDFLDAPVGLFNIFHTFKALKPCICGCINPGFRTVVFGVVTSSLLVPSHWPTKSTPDLVQVIAVPGIGYIIITYHALLECPA